MKRSGLSARRAGSFPEAPGGGHFIRRIFGIPHPANAGKQPDTATKLTIPAFPAMMKLYRTAAAVRLLRKEEDAYENEGMSVL